MRSAARYLHRSCDDQRGSSGAELDHHFGLRRENMVGDEVEEPDIRLPAAEMGKRIGGQIKFLKERPLALLAAAIEALEPPRRVYRPEGEAWEGDGWGEGVMKRGS